MESLIRDYKNPFRNGRIVAENVNPEIYHRDAAPRGSKEHVMGRSSLMDFLHCPHRWVKGWKSKGSESTEWGDLIDTKLLSPQRFAERFAIKPETYPADGGQKPWSGNSTWCKQWAADHADKQLVKSELNKDADEAVKSLLEDPEAGEFIRCSKKQVMVVAEYEDPETKVVVPVKILVDMVPDEAHVKFGDSLGDLKTSVDAHPWPWGRAVKSYHYDAQAAFYLWVWESARPQERKYFRHVIQENEPPYEPGKRIVGESFIERGQSVIVEALEQYARCLATNVWPGYEQPTPGAILMDGWLVTSVESWM